MADLRRATQSDIPQILSCLAEAFEPYRSAYTTGAFADTILDATTILARLDWMTVFVAIDHQHVVGTIGYQSSTAGENIRGMAVRPDRLGTRIAQTLLDAAELGLRGEGCYRAVLGTTSVLERAIRFYEKNGYVATGESHEFFGMDLLQLAKDL